MLNEGRVRSCKEKFGKVGKDKNCEAMCDNYYCALFSTTIIFIINHQYAVSG